MGREEDQHRGGGRYQMQFIGHRISREAKARGSILTSSLSPLNITELKTKIRIPLSRRDSSERGEKFEELEDQENP
jgi:hypothetical protein